MEALLVVARTDELVLVGSAVDEMLCHFFDELAVIFLEYFLVNSSGAVHSWSFEFFFTKRQIYAWDTKRNLFVKPS